MASRRSAGSTAWKFIVGILVALLAIVIIAEFGLRWFIGHQVDKTFQDTAAQQGVELPEDPDVSFGGGPLVFGIVRGKLPEINVHAPSTLQVNGMEVKGQPEADVTMQGMTLGSDPVADSFRATTRIPDDYLLAVFQSAIAEKTGIEGLGGLAVSSIRSDGASETLTMEFAGGLAKLGLHLGAESGTLAITQADSSFLGIGLSQGLREGVDNALAEISKQQLAGKNMRIEDAKVLDGALQLTLAGENLPLKQTGEQFGFETPA